MSDFRDYGNAKKAMVFQLLASPFVFVILVFVVFVTTCSIVAAQTAPNAPVPVRDALAIQRLNLALTALGGAQSVGQMDSCVEEATRAANGKSISVKRFNTGDDYRYETTLDGNMTVKTSRRTYKKTTTTSMNSGARGTALLKKDPPHIPVITPAMPIVPHLAPAVLLKRMLDSNTSLELISADQSPAGTIGILMKKPFAVTKQVEEQRWYFDSQTNLPVSVTYWLPSIISLRNHAVLQAKFENFGTLNGFIVPQLVTTSIGSMTLGVETVNSLQCQQSISTDLFTSAEVK